MSQLEIGKWSDLQREEPVATGGRTHGKRHRADVRFGHQRWPERQLYEVQLTPDSDWAVSMLRFWYRVITLASRSENLRCCTEPPSPAALSQPSLAITSRLGGLARIQLLST